MKRNFGIFSAVLLGGAVAAQANEGVNVGGYVDAQYNYATIKNYNGVSGNGGEKMANTFRFDEAAVWVSKKVGGTEAVIDLAIQGPALTYTRGFVSGNTGTAWSVGQSNSQAYVAMNYDNGFSWKLGQFDALFGFEANDSADIKFAHHGILSQLMPTTHVGLHGKYEFSDMLALNLLIANPYDAGHMKNGNLDYGVKLNTKFDTIAFNLGALFQTGDHYAAGSKKQLGYLIDWDLGSKMGALDWALYGYVSKADVKNAKTDWGAGVQGGYEVSELITAGLRFEYDKDGTKNTGVATVTSGAQSTFEKSTWSVTAGPAFNLSDNLVTKLDYTYTAKEIETAGAKDEAGHHVDLAAVYKF
jgi:hypothetical protein